MAAKSTIAQNRLISKKQDLSSTFNHNLSLPVHRWFRFSAGYSARWCGELIRSEKLNGRTRVLDPFVGSGTTLIESEFAGVDGIGIEAHPFIAKIAKSKQHWVQDAERFAIFGRKILEDAKKELAGNLDEYPEIVRKCFPEEILKKLHALKKILTESRKKDDSLSDLAWIALVSILRASSPVGTAQWQYLLPNKAKKAKDPFIAFADKIDLMRDDMLVSQSAFPQKTRGNILWEDARKCESVPDGWADLVITSPPYANNYDYADAMRLEMSFFGDINGWGDLQDTVRKYLIRACTQHVAKQAGEIDEVLNSDVLKPIEKEIREVCSKLEKERHLHGGKKPYHAMIAYYFKDLAEVWIALRRATSNGALICFVIGDSAPYGIYVPVDRWLGELAIAAGFKSYNFEKLRDRNIKWKNRKHRVPLHEGRLWVNG